MLLAYMPKCMCTTLILTAAEFTCFHSSIFQIGDQRFERTMIFAIFGIVVDWKLHRSSNHMVFVVVGILIRTHFGIIVSLCRSHDIQFAHGEIFQMISFDENSALWRRFWSAICWYCDVVGDRFGMILVWYKPLEAFKMC